MLRLSPSGTELKEVCLKPETIDAAAKEIRQSGAIVVENAIDRQLIEHARKIFFEEYGRYLDGRKHADTLEVGSGRLMITVDIRPPFDSSLFFANPFLLPLLQAVLGKSLVVDAFGVVCSLPSAPQQVRHSDGGILFPSSGLDLVLPTTAITLAIPLLDMNEFHGTTKLWLGSHRKNEIGKDDIGIEPVVQEGSCILWDFRVKHGGTANKSNVARPILYLTYCRPWWIDHLNFAKQKQTPLRVDKRTLARLSEDQKRLLARAQLY